MSQHTPGPYYFFRSCVGWDADDVHCDGGLRDLIDNRKTITRRTFLKHVDREDQQLLENDLCYERHPARGLTMSADWHVEYFRSELHGQRVYGFRHSAIEYVFTEPAQ